MKEKDASVMRSVGSRHNRIQRNVIDRLGELNVPLACQRAWNTYGGGHIFAGSKLRYDGRVVDLAALKDRVNISSSERASFVICVPKKQHYIGALTPSVRAGFTVVADDSGRLFLHQSVIFINRGDRVTRITETPTSTFVAVAAYEVSAWDTLTSRRKESHAGH